MLHSTLKILLIVLTNKKKEKKNQIKYINIDSNHPPATIKQLPLSSESRLSSLSSSEEIFNDSVTPYQDALNKSRYKHKLKYQANTDTGNNKKQRKRNIVWFNPPYSKNVKTNIGKLFINLIKNTFHFIINSTNYLTRIQ